MPSLERLLADVEGVKDLPDEATRKTLIADFTGATTHSFDDTGREQYASVMQKAGYVELPQIKADDAENGYLCRNCEYYRKEENSPTGYWCGKFNFPDRANGCCDGWELSPNLKEFTVKFKRHGHTTDVFRGAVGRERGLARNLKALMNRYREKELDWDAAVKEAAALIKTHDLALRDYALQHVQRTHPNVKELSPEMIHRYEERTQKSLRDFKLILLDAK